MIWEKYHYQFIKETFQGYQPVLDTVKKYEFIYLIRLVYRTSAFPFG